MAVLYHNVIHVVSNHGIFLDIYEWRILPHIRSITCNLQKTTNRRSIVMAYSVVIVQAIIRKGAGR
jgi:hypothetical protein